MAAHVKLDFQKAYDILNWDFIDHVLDLMGFGKTWRRWTMECITTASVSILVNGSPTTPPKNGEGP